MARAPRLRWARRWRLATCRPCAQRRPRCCTTYRHKRAVCSSRLAASCPATRWSCWARHRAGCLVSSSASDRWPMCPTSARRRRWWLYSAGQDACAQSSPRGSPIRPSASAANATRYWPTTTAKRNDNRREGAQGLGGQRIGLGHWNKSIALVCEKLEAKPPFRLLQGLADRWLRNTKCRGGPGNGAPFHDQAKTSISRSVKIITSNHDVCHKLYLHI
jgi:hypothetical protein